MVSLGEISSSIYIADNSILSHISLITDIAISYYI